MINQKQFNNNIAEQIINSFIYIKQAMFLTHQFNLFTFKIELYFGSKYVLYNEFY